MNNAEIKIADSALCIPLEPIISAMTFEQKRETLAWLATDDEVIRSVVSHITGNDDQGWSTGDPDRRQQILTEIEDSQIDGLRYSWKPWGEARQKLKDIRSSEQIYWVLYHKIDPEVSRQVFNELQRLGIESNYTTEQANSDVESIKTLIENAFAGMKETKEIAQP